MNNLHEQTLTTSLRFGFGFDKQKQAPHPSRRLGTETLFGNGTDYRECGSTENRTALRGLAKMPF